MPHLLSRFSSRLFIRNPYRMLKRLSLNKLRIRTAIHVGAHLAQERGYYEQMGLKKIVWVEGSPATYRNLRRTLENEISNGTLTSEHVAVNALVSDRPGQELTLFGFSNGGVSNSIFQPTESFRQRWPDVDLSGSEESVVTSRLDDVAKATDMEETDLITLDVQGAELLVLKGGTKTLSQATAVICEVSKKPFYAGGALYPEIQEYMQSHGFWQMHASHTHGDVLFLRKDRM